MNESDGFACGPYSFDQNGDAKKDTSYVCQIKGGQWVFQSKEKVDS